MGFTVWPNAFPQPGLMQESYLWGTDPLLYPLSPSGYVFEMAISFAEMECILGGTCTVCVLELHGTLGRKMESLL